MTLLEKFITIFFILLIGTQAVASQKNPYQQMWFDAWWRKDCIFDSKLQMCISESENYRNLKEYNRERKVNKFYCIGGNLYREMGFNKQLILQTTTNDAPITCSTENVSSYKVQPTLTLKQKRAERRRYLDMHKRYRNFCK